MIRPPLFYSFFACLFFFYLMIFSGCSNSDEDKIKQEDVSGGPPVRGGIYRVPMPSSPATLDPAYVQDIYGIELVYQIFDRLVRFDAYLSLLPGLAETWQVKEEGKVYRFTLRKNARFHNLEPVTSGDVIFSIQRLLRAEPAPAVQPHLLKIAGAKEYKEKLREDIPGLQIEDDKVFEIRLDESYVPFLTALGMYQASIVPQKEVTRLGDEFGKQPVGSGPFAFMSWNAEEALHLKRFDGYYAGSAFLDEIHYKIYPSSQDLKELTDFQNGLIEEMAVYGDVKEKLSDVKGLQWVHRPALSLFFYGMNLNHPNLKNPDLRKALSIAIDRNTLISQVYKGRFETATTILPPGMPGYTPLSRMEDNNPAMARKLLNASFGNAVNELPELEIVSAYKTPRVEQEMDLIKSFWEAIGIRLRVNYITDWKKFESYLDSEAVQIYRYSWAADMPDPDSFLYSLFASESPVNFMKFKDATVDRSLLTARGIADPVLRAKAYQNIEAAVMASTPLIPLFYLSVDRVYQSYVRSVNVSALGAETMPLNQVWLDKTTRK